MKRRNLLQHGGLAGILAASSAPALAQSMPEVRWRLTSSYPKSLDTLIGAAEHFTKRLADITGGKFQLRVHAAGEVVPVGLGLGDRLLQHHHTRSCEHLGAREPAARRQRATLYRVANHGRLHVEGPNGKEGSSDREI